MISILLFILKAMGKISKGELGSLSLERRAFHEQACVIKQAETAER